MNTSILLLAVLLGRRRAYGRMTVRNMTSCMYVLSQKVNYPCLRFDGFRMRLRMILECFNAH